MTSLELTVATEVRGDDVEISEDVFASHDRPTMTHRTNSVMR